MMVEAPSYQEIADELYIELSTVQKHIRNIMEKLELNRQGQLVKYAIERQMKGGDSEGRR